MANFTYRVLDKNGKISTGIAEFQNLEEATAELTRNGTTILHLQRKSFSFKKTQKKVKSKEVAYFFNQLSYLLKTGLSLYKGIELIQGQIKNDKLRNMLKKCLKDLTEGVSFSDALSLHPEIFAENIVFQIKAAEDGGYLDNALFTLSIDIERDAEYKSSVIKSMIYPISMLVASVLVVIFMVLYLIPKMTTALSEFGAEMPAITQMLVEISVFSKNYFIHALVIVGGAVGTFIYLRKQEEYRYKMDELLLKIPIIGETVKLFNLARITRAMSSLLGSGVPINDTFDNLSKVTSNRKIRSELLNVKKRIINEGMPISAAFSMGDIFPELMIQILMVGEETGSLSDVLQKFSENTEKESKEMMNALKGMLTPILTIFIGMIVGVVVISLFLPIFSLMDQF